MPTSHINVARSLKPACFGKSVFEPVYAMNAISETAPKEYADVLVKNSGVSLGAMFRNDAGNYQESG